MPLSYTPPHLLSLPAVPLGLLTLSLTNPTHDSHPPPSTPAPAVLTTPTSTFSETLSLTRDSRTSSFLTVLLTAHYRNSGTYTARVEAAATSVVSLTNATAIFDAACAQAETRKWLQRAVGRGKGVFTVVGLHVLTDAELRAGEEKGVERGGRIGTSGVAGMGSGAGGGWRCGGGGQEGE